MTSIDGKTTGLSQEVYGALKELQKARKGEALTEKDVQTVIKVMAKDGKIDQAELDLLDEIMANSVEVKVSKGEHDSKPVTVKFAQTQGTNFRDQALEKAADVARRSAMYVRARGDRGTGEIDSLKRILQTDQKLAGVNADGSKTKYGAKGDVATKVLIQDAVLLERKGLLTPDDQTFLNEMIQKRIGNKELSPEDIQRLDQMVEKALTYLDGPHAEIRQVDQASLLDVGPDGTGSPADQYAKVEANYQGLQTEADAAIHDVAASTREYGLNSEALKEQKGQDVEAGRSFERIAEAVEEADRQFLLLHDNVLPAVKQQSDALKQQIDKRLMEITGKGTIDEALKALEADPKLRDKARNDKPLQELNGKHADVQAKFNALSAKMLALDDARVNGVKALSSIKIIDKEMKERIASVRGMSAKLNEGITGLNSLRNEVVSKTRSLDGVNKQAKDIESGALTGTTDQEQLDEVKRKELELAGAEGKVKIADKDLADLKKKSEAVCDQMISGMESLIATYEASGTATPTSVKLLKEELATLKALRQSFDKNFDPLKAVQDLEGSRNKILGTLKKLVPAHLDLREYKALAALDGNVSSFSAAQQDFKASHDYAVGRSTAAKNSIGSARELVLATGEELKTAIERAESGHDSVLEETAHNMESIPETSTKKGGLEIHGGLAYGSHARVYLGIGVGVGADIGVLEAKVAVGIEGALKVEKKFGSGPEYLIHADLAAKITAEVNLDLLFAEVGVSAEIKAGLRVGLAFKEGPEMLQFGKDLAEFVSLCLKLRDAKTKDEFSSLKDQLKASMGKLEKTVSEHKYDGAFLESKVELEVESHSAPGGKVKAELKGGTDISSFADGSEVRDTRVSGLLQVGEFGIEVAKETSTVTKQPTVPGPHPLTDTWRVVAEFKVPAKVLKEILEHGSLARLPKGVLEEVVKTIKSANPSMAMFEAGVILATLDKALPSNKKGLAKMVAMAERMEKARGPKEAGHGHVKKEIGISVGISVGKNHHGKNFMAVEFNIEGSVDYKQDFGGGSNFVRLEAGASAKVGLEVEVEWGGDHPPGAEHGTQPGGHETPAPGGHH